MSIRHIVMWKLRDVADTPRFKGLLDSCKDVVPGMLEFDVVIKVDGLEASCDVALVSTFKDADALAAYQAHPHHKSVAAQLGTMREQRHVFDYAL